MGKLAYAACKILLLQQRLLSVSDEEGEVSLVTVTVVVILLVSHQRITVSLSKFLSAVRRGSVA